MSSLPPLASECQGKEMGRQGRQRDGEAGRQHFFLWAWFALGLGAAGTAVPQGLSPPAEQRASHLQKGLSRINESCPIPGSQSGAGPPLLELGDGNSAEDHETCK